MSEHLILIAVGPVQDFIAAARKLRDLWFGSHMLSELSKTVARALRDTDCELIFPGIQSDADLTQGSGFAVVNKILARVPSHLNPAEIAKNAESSMRDLIHEYAEKALINAKKIGIRIDDNQFREQILDIGEFYAAWVPLTDYAESRDRLESLMAGRKALRNFKEPTWCGKGRHKSSLDGARETVIGEKHPEKIGLLKNGERLDTIGVIKRFYPLGKSPHFDDLSDIAIIPYLQRIEQCPQAKEALAGLENECRNTDWEKGVAAKRHTNVGFFSDLFFEDPRSDSVSPEIGKALQSLQKTADSKPGAYAAVLVGDGDHMGLAIDKIPTIEGHQTFGRYLSEFSCEAGVIVAKHQGSLIYSGGDDVMAYLPLNAFAECCYELQDSFKKLMAKALAEINVAVPNPPTFSAGVAIVHHSCPLSRAHELARSAEKMAKAEGGRDALAIIQDKRSGAPRPALGKWGQCYPDLQSMVQLFCEGKLPATFAYDLLAIARRSGSEIRMTTDSPAEPANTTAACILRLLDAKQRVGDKVDQESAARMRQLMSHSNDVRSFANLAIVAHQIALSIELTKVAQKREETK